MHISAQLMSDVAIAEPDNKLLANRIKNCPTLRLLPRPMAQFAAQNHHHPCTHHLFYKHNPMHNYLKPITSASVYTPRQ